jgi:PAS domain S-box-containing protein
MQTELWRVLHIDDDEEDHYLVKLMLSDAKGQTVTLDWAATIEEARQKLSQDHYQAVLVDYDLQVTTGIDLIREFVNKEYPAPMILLTGRGSYDVDIEAMQAGATLYLTKNEINPLLLERSIRYAIERKQTEKILLEKERALEKSNKALRQSEAKIRAVFQSLVEGVVFLNPQGVVEEANQAVVTTYNHTLDELKDPEKDPRFRIIRPDGSLFPEEEQPAIAALSSGKAVRDVEMGVPLSNGEISWRLVNAQPVYDDSGTLLGAVASFFDITERKMAEEATSKSRAKLEAALNSMTDAVFISDREGRFIEFNDAFAAFHRFRSKEECAKTFAEYPDILDVYFPDGTPAPVEMWAVPRALRGETASNVEYTLYRKDTGQTWIGSYSFAPIRDQNSDIIGSVVVGRDITAYKRTIEALRQSEEKFRFIAANIHDTLFFQDLDLRYTWIFNASNPLDDNQVIDKTDSDLLPAQEAEQLTAIKRRVLDTGTSTRVELQLSPGGDTRWFEAVFEPARDARGEIVGIISYSRDITERKHNEQALRESEQRYSALFNAKTNGIAHCRVITDEQGRPVDYEILQINQAYEDITGIQRKDIEGRRAREVFPGIENYEYDYIGNYGKVALLGEELNIEVFFEGLQQWLAIYCYSPQLGEFTAIFTDISQRKRAEQAMREGEQRFRQLADAMPQLLWTAQPDGAVDYYNQRYDLYDGIAPVNEHQWEWGPALHPQDLQPTVDAWNKAVETQEVYQIEHRVRTSNGSYRWHLSRGTPCFDDQGRLEKWYGTATDIHDFKLAQEQLNQFTEELERSNKELESFAFIASHDLQEPLRKIHLFGSMLKRQIDDHQVDETKESIVRIQNAAERMQTMIDGLLALSRINLHGSDFEQVDLTQVAHEVVSDLEARIQLSGGRVLISDLPELKGDILQLRQLLLNLVGNALKYHEKGSPPLVKIFGELTAAAEVPLVRIFIEDNGIGFDPSHAERIFQPFVRLHGPVKYEGSGMGLAICQKIVERHGGSISVTSQPGLGSRFTVTLPA